LAATGTRVFKRVPACCITAMNIPPTILVIAYIIVFFVVLVASASFIYHWKRYGMNTRIIRAIITLYSTLTVVLLLSALVLLFIILS